MKGKYFMFKKFYEALKDNRFDQAVLIANHIDPSLIKEELREHSSTCLLTTGLTLLLTANFQEFLSTITAKYQVLIDGIKASKRADWKVNIDKTLDKDKIGNDLISSGRLFLSI